ncbi:cell division protein FtsQ/DivIB [Paragemmobacter straminiformis]|uniref:Cell division protein FtsQ n=1 Tax=Paragemmobacter straminiformis TaxID=2045119 RepID=A0A842ICM9_9RHOB|nr:cell division protein FtsQ/DivIB [Gemmobacter straminiformis]MBC2837296.1 FtsQ-type POTRA domain-containing protein [Gemmobacter straminiformis]
MQPVMNHGGQRRVYIRQPRRDPAPSRWAYRMQRLWLTPLFRLLFRVGLPVLVLGGVTAIYVANDARRAGLVQGYVDLREKFQNRPEFMVGLVSVEGASTELAEAIRARAGLKLPASSFDLDLDAARARIEDLDAVAKAELRVRSGGVLQVLITERMPVMVWRTDDRIEMLDETGHRVASLGARADRADLPLIAGAGADKAAGEALEIFAAAQPVLPRVRGLVRIGDRRWDVVLDRNQKIMLPEHNAVAALERLIALDRAEDLLARDVLTVDLRNEERPVLRLAPNAMNERRKAQGIDTSGSEL